MAAISVTYTPVNGDVNDVTKITQNFTDITNGLSDGTKDLTINKLTTTVGITCGGSMTVAGDLYTVAFTDYSGSVTESGWAAGATKACWYRRTGGLVTYWFAITGTADDTAIQFTAPIAGKTGKDFWGSAYEYQAGGTAYEGPTVVFLNGTTVTAYHKGDSASAFAGTGALWIKGMIQYEAQ